jgi:hypothetical protein
VKRISKTSSENKLARLALSVTPCILERGCVAFAVYGEEGDREVKEGRINP